MANIWPPVHWAIVVDGKLVKECKYMNKPQLDSVIMKQSGAWGENFNSMEGCKHNSAMDKVEDKVNGKDVTINIMSKMDMSHAKPSSDNPGFDKGFWAKADPQTDTVEGFKLTRALKDRKS